MIRRSICVFVTLAVSAAFAQTLTRKHYDAWNRANGYRRASLLLDYALNDALNRAAQGHADYIEKHGAIGHYQEKSKPGFTGEDPAVRATNAGYPWMAIMEDISGEPDPARSIDTLIASVYHRLPFINHEMRDVGFGFVPKGVVVVFAAMQRTPVPSSPILCPGDGATAVPPMWASNESPNPLPPDVKVPVGCPVSISFPGAKKIELMAGTLETLTGVKVDCVTLTPTTDPHKLLKHDIFLVPKKPLEERQTYRATVDVLVDGTRKPKTWFFTTGSK